MTHFFRQSILINRFSIKIKLIFNYYMASATFSEMVRSNWLRRSDWQLLLSRNVLVLVQMTAESANL